MTWYKKNQLCVDVLYDDETLQNCHVKRYCCEEVSTIISDLSFFANRCQQVRERMICHAIVGNNTGKEKIMKVDVIADFIEPLVNFSDRKISFFVMKVCLVLFLCQLVVLFGGSFCFHFWLYLWNLRAMFPSILDSSLHLVDLKATEKSLYGLNIS